MQQENDIRVLIFALQQGETREFQRFYRIVGPHVLKRCKRMLYNHQEVEDCVQLVFLSMVENIAQYRGEGPVLAWINRIITNVILQHFRKKKRFSRFLGSFRNLLHTKPSEHSLPEGNFLAEERKVILHKALEELSPKKRIALLLCEFEGYSLEEAAEELEISVGTVGSRIHHARKDLKVSLERTLKKENISFEEWMNAN